MCPRSWSIPPGSAKGNAGTVSSQGPDALEIVTHRIPRIEVYQVTDDELCRIEEGGSQVAQDLAFALAAASVAVSLAIALLTGTFTPRVGTILGISAGVLGVTALYTGIRWRRHRLAAPNVISNIRSRRVNPEPGPGASSHGSPSH